MLLQQTHIINQLLEQGQVFECLTGDSKGGLLVHDVGRQRQAFDGSTAPTSLSSQQQLRQDLSTLLINNGSTFPLAAPGTMTVQRYLSRSPLPWCIPGPFTVLWGSLCRLLGLVLLLLLLPGLRPSTCQDCLEFLRNLGHG